VADNLRTFTITPQRFEALKEAVLRGLRSYEQSEAYVLARNRRDALMREHQFLPPETIAATQKATWADVQAFARRFFARGKFEAVVHGHLSPEQAIAAVRGFVRKVGAQPAPDADLLRRRHVVIAPGENVVDAGPINGVNSAFTRDYLLPDDSPQSRVASVVLSNFFGDPFYSELRTKQQLGYIVGSNAAASLRHRYFVFVIQSSTHAPDDLERRAEAFIATLPDQFAKISDEQWRTLVAGARSLFEEKSKTIREKAEIFFGRAFLYDGEWDRQQSALAALEKLTKEDALAYLRAAFDPATARRRTVLLAGKNHQSAPLPTPTFTDREAWQARRKFQ
jgi:insulysin